MTITEYFTNDPILFLILLFGVISYWIASGAERANYRLLHVILGIALFFGIGFGIYYIIKLCSNSPGIGTTVGIVAVVISAYLWRRWLADCVYQYLRDWGITATSFGPSRVWDTIISAPERRFYHFHVELNDGTVLVSNTKKLVKIDPDCPPEMRSDEEGNVALLVTKIRKKNKKTIKNKPVSKKRMMEYTYIPASSIRTIRAHFRKEK